jgi:signal peptidase I
MISKKQWIIIVLVLAIILFALFFCFSKKKEIAAPVYYSPDCVASTREMTVQGYSMSPYLLPGDVVTALFGYYSCHAIERGDVVLYDYSGDQNLLIKFVKAVPGDSWSLKEENGSYGMVVNGSALLNSEGKPYLIGNYKMLELYVKSYPVIPANTYLILGDNTDGSLDSTHFGLVSGGDIKAKVVWGK